MILEKKSSEYHCVIERWLLLLGRMLNSMQKKMFVGGHIMSVLLQFRR